MLVGTLSAGTPTAFATMPDIIEGTAHYLYVAGGTAGLFVFDLSSEVLPTEPVKVVEGINAIEVSRAGGFLYVVVQGVGVNIYTEDPNDPQLVATVAAAGAVRAVPWGIHLFVAAGEDGLMVIDISDHNSPTHVGTLSGINATDVTLYAHFQNSRRFAARAYVADPDSGVRVVDLLPEFSSPVLVGGLPLVGASGLDTYTRYVPAEVAPIRRDGTPRGGPDTPSREHDYLYVAAGAAGLHIFDITEPDQIVEVAALTNLGGLALDVDVSSEMNPPGTDDYAVVANSVAGLQLIDVTNPLQPFLQATAEAPGAGRALVEVQAMDRFIDEQGQSLKENSHPGVGLLSREDIVRILSADIVTDCTMTGDFDGDWDVDLIDFVHFSQCVTGPEGGVPPGCDVADTDSDGDVDFIDFAAFQARFTGAG